MIKDPIRALGVTPFDISVLQSLYPSCRYIKDKARRLEEDGRIIRLKRGLYVAIQDDRPICSELVANSLYGPSYVSRASALRYWGLIPEHVYLSSSVTIKHKRYFKTPIGDFDYQNCSPAYFSIGIVEEVDRGAHFLIASPTKALCDYLNYWGYNLRFVKEVEPFLKEDLRFDMDRLDELDPDVIDACAKYGRKGGTLKVLLKYIRNERSI